MATSPHGPSLAQDSSLSPPCPPPRSPQATAPCSHHKPRGLLTLDQAKQNGNSKGNGEGKQKSIPSVEFRATMSFTLASVKRKGTNK